MLVFWYVCLSVWDGFFGCSMMCLLLWCGVSNSGVCKVCIVMLLCVMGVNNSVLFYVVIFMCCLVGCVGLNCVVLMVNVIRVDVLLVLVLICVML